MMSGIDHPRRQARPGRLCHRLLDQVGAGEIRTTLVIAGLTMIAAGTAAIALSPDTDRTPLQRPPANAAVGCDPGGRPVDRDPNSMSGDPRARWRAAVRADGGAPGEVLFSSDFESGSFDDWYVQSLSSRARIVSPGAFGSDHAARFEVRDGDVEPDTGSERSEVSGPDVDEGQDLYFRDTFRIPSGSSIGTSWQIINQLHEHDWNGSPGVAVFLDSGPSLRIGAGDGSPTFVEDVPLRHDTWHDLVYRTKLSRDRSIGFVEVWLDGNPLKLANGQTRIYGQTLQTSSAYLKAGIYRGRASTGTSIIEHDNLTVATSLQAATSD